MSIKIFLMLITLGMPACEYEDSENCYWDASTMGNGVGVSFVNVDGEWFTVDQ